MGNKVNHFKTTLFFSYIFLIMVCCHGCCIKGVPDAATSKPVALEQHSRGLICVASVQYDLFDLRRITLLTTLVNVGTEPLTFSSGDGSGWIIEAFRDGSPVAFTPTGKTKAPQFSITYSHSSSELAPGDSAMASFEIGNWFEFSTSGEYKIRATKNGVDPKGQQVKPAVYLATIHVRGEK